MRRALALAILSLTTPARAADKPRDVVDYTLRATLDTSAHVVHGQGTIVWRNTSDKPTSELWVHLYLNAFKSEKSVFLSEPVGRARGASLPSDWGHIDVQRLVWNGEDLWRSAELHRAPNESDETDARVPLPRPAQPGEMVSLDVAFDAKLPTVVERTGYEGSFHMVAQWFPKIARLEPDGTWAHFPFHHLAEFYADFGTYDVTLDVPEGFTIGATGSVVDKKIDGGRRVERRVQEDVHDFAWTAWDGFESRAETIAGVEVTALFPRGFRVDAERELATMRFAIPHYAERYGAYPYPVLTLVHPPDAAQEAGGMEYPTLITTGGPWYGPPGILGIESVTIHEFGHQYFYGLLASNEALWPFLDEGLNSFAEQEGLRAWRGPGSAVDLFGLELSNMSAQLYFSRRVAHNEPVAQPAWAFASGRDYSGLVYGRTSTVLETLRRVYGEPMMTSFGRYTREQRFQHPTPDDLIDVLGHDLGDDASRALRVSLFDRGWVDYAALAMTSRKAHTPAGIEGGAVVPLRSGETGDYEGWALVARRGTVALPVDVELVYESGFRERRAWDGKGDTKRFDFRSASPLAFVVIDPDHKVLLDDDWTNNFTSAEGSSGSTRRSLERVTYWGELIATLLGP